MGTNTPTELIYVVEQAPEGGYTASALGVDIITEGDTLEELRHNVREATEVYFDEGQQPRMIRLHFVREEVLPLTPA